MLTTLQRIPQRKSCYSTSKRIGAERKRIVHFLWLRGKCRCRWKMAWERCSRDEIHIQIATGPPVIAEGYQDNGRLSDHYNSGRSICMESYPIRFLTARQEQTEVVTRAGLVFSMRRGLFLYPRTAGAACCTAIR